MTSRHFHASTDVFRQSAQTARYLTFFFFQYPHMPITYYSCWYVMVTCCNSYGKVPYHRTIYIGRSCQPPFLFAKERAKGPRPGQTPSLLGLAIGRTYVHPWSVLARPPNNQSRSRPVPFTYDHNAKRLFLCSQVVHDLRIATHTSFSFVAVKGRSRTFLLSSSIRWRTCRQRILSGKRSHSS